MCDRVHSNRNHTEIKIELKGPGTVLPVLEIVERLDMQERCSYSSFALDQVTDLRTVRPDKKLYRTGALFEVPPEDYLEQAIAAGATEIHLQYDHCSISRIQEIHEAGFRSMAWVRGAPGMASDVIDKYWDMVAEDAECYQAVIDTGVQQICCNKPDVLLQLLRQQQHQQRRQQQQQQQPEEAY